MNKQEIDDRVLKGLEDWEDRKTAQKESQDELGRVIDRLARREAILEKYPPLLNIGE